MARSVLCVLLLAVAFVHGKHEKYEGHQLYRVSGPSHEIGALEAHLDIISATPAARSTTGNLEALVRLAPEEKQKWLQYFNTKEMTYTKVIDNLADILRNEEAMIKQRKYAAKRSGKSISWDSYYNSEEINNYIDQLGEEFPDKVTVINAALSYEGRQIKYVRISTSRFEDLRKPVIIIDAGVHAREWVTAPVALYIIHQLVVDVVDNNLTERLDWVIIPMANPDGYEYSITTDRMWRKTRSKAHEGSDECPGVDGNRNFDHYFGTSAASANPCSIIYEGPAPFSEPEIRVIRDVVLQNLDRAAMYISVHSFGNMFLYAWGNNGSLPSNALSLHVAGVRMATAIDEMALEKADRYIVGNAANVLYYTTGTSRDWTRAVGIPLTYTLELPGYEYGFLVPPTYVEQIVTETWDGISAGAHYVLSLQSLY
ncbi:PREDICTED: carboxypeptidase B-like [Papilio polytes]|uniref:carboxypeptidase B-like n=1 Tax=Papilio polytes TaxID=76194 RepID=UPI000675D1EA|nr:PREDICTED: carboxypeptidase B-like [Papilio polytes]